MQISIIIPVLNESTQILKTLQPLQFMRQRNVDIILVDGGSTDNTCILSKEYVDKIVHSRPGRAHQMNAGADAATGSIFWFLHADTVVPENADRLIQQQIITTGKSWGRFDVRLSGSSIMMSIIALMMNLRSCLTGIVTGDQGLFVTSQVFREVGCFPEIPLMEDIEISKQLKYIHRPCIVQEKIITSSRRWEKKGVFHTILFMWFLRLSYFFGVPPSRLREWYES